MSISNRLRNFLNCPYVVSFFPQVIGFVQKLTDLLPDYEIACEHEHSNCLLICHKKVKVEGVTSDFSSQTGKAYRQIKFCF